MMKAFLCGLAFFAALKMSAQEIGTPAPALNATNAAGKTLSLNDATSTLTYVDFWASWCAPCKQSFPWMNAMHEKYQKQGLRVVAINVDKRRDDADKFLKQVSAQFEIGFDAEGKTPAAYSVKAMPTSLLIDRAGKVIWVHRGFRASDTENMEAAIVKYLQEGKK